MSAKRQTRPTPKRPEVVFLSCDLDKQLKKDLLVWVSEPRDYLEMIEKCADSGLKFGASFDHFNECFQASLTQPASDENDNITRILIGRGGNMQQAIQALFFKYAVMLETRLDDMDRQNPRGVSDWG